jgi:hypothetical protein
MHNHSFGGNGGNMPVASNVAQFPQAAVPWAKYLLRALELRGLTVQDLLWIQRSTNYPEALLDGG